MGRTCEVFLISPDGRKYTTKEAAAAMGKTIDAVRCGCVRPRTEYMGWKIERTEFPKSYELEEANRKNGEGYDSITLKELYEQYLWCRESPGMIRIMRDFSGAKNVTPLIKLFERWRHEAKRIGET